MTQTIVNLGTGGPVLNGRNGSTGGADSNDALFLDWDGENYVYLPGVNGNFLSVPDEDALDITGDIDIRVQVAMDDWTPSASQRLVSKSVSGEWTYILNLNTAGTLLLGVSTDGVGLLQRTSTASVSATDGSAKWVRATLDVDNGLSGHDVKFFTSDDGASWTQIGATVTTAGTLTLNTNSRPLAIGAESSGGVAATGKVYRAQVFNGIDGTKVLDVDTSVLTTGAATTFTALTGQTVTINRSTAGRKAVAVVSPCWLFGTDDYMEVADNDLIDFGAADSFTVLAVVRQWATPTNFGRWLSKWTTSGAGWHVVSNGTNLAIMSQISDGTNSGTPLTANRPSFAAGNVTVVGIRVDRSEQSLSAISGAAIASPTNISAVGSLTNSLPLRVGANAGSLGSINDFELLAVAVFRRALTETEISRITAYYQARLS